MRHFRLVSALALLAVAPLAGASAQVLEPASAPVANAAPVPGASAGEPTPGALAAADELLRLMELEPIMRAGALSMLDLQIQQQPALAPFRDVMQVWAERFLTWQEMGPRLTRIYAEAFTEAELRDLAAFYRTPTGRKLAAVQPALTQRGAQAGAEVAAAHLAELEAMMAARAAELEGGATGP